MSSRFRDSPPNGPSRWQNNNGNSCRHHPNRRKGNNPIGNWINRRRRNRPTNETGTRAVGTEAMAIQNITNNSKYFKYPKEGFITPIEHSLLYAMILYPKQYPESVIRKEIEDEDFESYLFVKDDGKTPTATNVTNGDDVANDEIQYEERASYAQLSALLALSAEKNSATPSQEKWQQQQRETESQTRNSLTMQATSNISRSPKIENLTVGQALCRKILKTVIKYSEAHNLDRQQEISELMEPVETRCQSRNEQAALKQLLPAYAGYTLSLVTGNPLPLLIGAASLAGQDPMMEENSNLCEMKGMGGRMGDWETAGLLDECDDD